MLAAENGGGYVDTFHGPNGVGAVAAAVSNGRPTLAHAIAIGKKWKIKENSFDYYLEMFTKIRCQLTRCSLIIEQSSCGQYTNEKANNKVIIIDEFIFLKKCSLFITKMTSYAWEKSRRLAL